MKFGFPTIALLALLGSSTAQAAPCRAAAAAIQGSQRSYEKDVQAAQQTVQKDRTSSDILGKCVSGVTAVMTVPQFPSLSQIFEQIKKEVCRIASEQVNGAVNDVNQQINGALSGINSQIGGMNGQLPPVVGPIVPPVVGPIVKQVPLSPSPAPSQSDFWGNIWK